MTRLIPISLDPVSTLHLASLSEQTLNKRLLVYTHSPHTAALSQVMFSPEDVPSMMYKEKVCLCLIFLDDYIRVMMY